MFKCNKFALEVRALTNILVSPPVDLPEVAANVYRGVRLSRPLQKVDIAQVPGDTE